MLLRQVFYYVLSYYRCCKRICEAESQMLLMQKLFLRMHIHL